MSAALSGNSREKSRNPILVIRTTVNKIHTYRSDIPEHNQLPPLGAHSCRASYLMTGGANRGYRPFSPNSGGSRVRSGSQQDSATERLSRNRGMPKFFDRQRLLGSNRQFLHDSNDYL